MPHPMVCEHVLFWRTQNDIDNDRPTIVEVHRAENVEGTWYIHGSSHFVSFAQYAFTVGDPLEVGENADQISASPLGLVPAVGGCTLPDPSQGNVSNLPITPISIPLSLNTWDTITGGSLSSDAKDISWDSGSGELTIGRHGTWWISFSLSAEWMTALVTPRITAAIWTESGITSIAARMPIVTLGGGGTVGASLPLKLLEGDVLRLRVQSTLTGTLDLTSFNVGAVRWQW